MPAPPLPLDPRIKQWTPLVRGLAHYYYRQGLGRVYEIEDLISIGMQALWRATQGYRPGGAAQFQTYARRVIQHTFGYELKRLRTQNRRVIWFERSTDIVHESSGDPVLELVDPIPSGEGLLEQQKEGILLRETLEHLLPRDKRLIELRYLEGLEFDEIAKIFGITTQRCRQIESRALIRLHRLLRDEFSHLLPIATIEHSGSCDSHQAPKVARSA